MMRKIITTAIGAQRMMMKKLLITGVLGSTPGMSHPMNAMASPKVAESTIQVSVEGGVVRGNLLWRSSRSLSQIEFGTKHALATHIVAENEPTKLSGINMKRR